MAEFKKRWRWAVIVAVALAAGVSLLAFYDLLPRGCPSPGGYVPEALIGLMSAQEVSCVYSTGVCSMTLANNSTVPVVLVACQFSVVLSSNRTVTVWGIVQGSVGGQATTNVPASSRITGTCTMPYTRLVHETNGTLASGLFTVKLLENWECVPAGNEPSFGFAGTWT